MAKTDNDIHGECMQRFLDLANSMKEEGIDTRIVSAGLMTGSAVYSTYVSAGNDGLLAPEGVDTVTAAYKEQLQMVQAAKEEQFSAKTKTAG